MRTLVPFLLIAVAAVAQEPPAAEAPTPAASKPAVLVAPLELVPDASGTVPQEQIRELLRRVAEKDLENQGRLRNYTYTQREEERKLDGDGKVKKVESRTSEILVVYGEHIERLIAKDDKPLSPEDAKREDERIEKITEKRKNESEHDRRDRLEEEAKRREDGRKFVREIADAYDFRLTGSEPVDERETWVLEAEPRADYQPKSREARMLPKLKGRIWIDKADLQWKRFDITTIDTISVGLFLARIHKGTHVVVETTRVNDEVWLPKHVIVHVDARVALLKSFNQDVEQTFRDYKRFRTDANFTVVGEPTP